MNLRVRVLSDLVLGFFLGSKIESKLDKEAMALKLKEIKSCLSVPGIGMRKQKLIPVVGISFGLLKVTVLKFSSCSEWAHSFYTADSCTQSGCAGHISS